MTVYGLEPEHEPPAEPSLEQGAGEHAQLLAARRLRNEHRPRGHGRTTRTHGNARREPEHLALRKRRPQAPDSVQHTCSSRSSPGTPTRSAPGTSRTAEAEHLQPSPRRPVRTAPTPFSPIAGATCFLDLERRPSGRPRRCGAGVTNLSIGARADRPGRVGDDGRFQPDRQRARPGHDRADQRAGSATAAVSARTAPRAALQRRGAGDADARPMTPAARV